MTITFFLGIVITAVDAMFDHFRGIYGVFDLDILYFIIGSYLTIIGLRLVNNSGSSLSRSIDVPRMVSDRRSSQINNSMSRDQRQNVSKE